jgi:predicted small lipoprotein YifL
MRPCMVLSTLVFLGALAGCGQKGPLYLPKPEPETATKAQGEPPPEPVERKEEGKP